LISLSLIAPERQRIAQPESAEADSGQNEHTYPTLPELTLLSGRTRRADVYLPRAKGRLQHGGEVID